ncbi:MAG: ABC transporter substrate-binding protein [Desulfitobacteriaceae bacterium]
MKRVQWWQKLTVLTLAMGLLLVGCGQTGGTSPTTSNKNTSSTNKDPYVIGFVAAATGLASSLGQPETQTAKMLEKQINDAGGINGHPLKIVIYDDESTEAKANLAAKKLIEQDKVLAFVGGTTSGSAQAMLKLAEDAKIPFIAMGAAVQLVEPVKPYTFKTPQTDRLVLQTSIDKAIKPNNWTKIAWLNVNDSYGDGGRVEWEKLVEPNGLTTVLNERFNTNDTDFSGQIVKIKNSNPDVILIYSRPPSAALINKAIRQAGITKPIIQSHGIANQTFIDTAGSSAEGVILAAGKLLIAGQLPDTDPQKKTLLDYAQKYKEFSGKSADTFGGHAWDGIMMIVNALKSGANTPEAIRNYLENNTKNFVGISGVFNMSAKDHMGLDANALAVLQIKNGKWAPYQK